MIVYFVAEKILSDFSIAFNKNQLGSVKIILHDFTCIW